MSTAHPFDVQVKTWLPTDVFRELVRLADEHGTTVSVLVAIAARSAVTPPRPKRVYSPMTADRFARLQNLAMTEMTYQQIATELGVSRSTVHNHIHRARSQA